MIEIDGRKSIYIGYRIGIIISQCKRKFSPNFQDGNGSIENEELRGFLKDLLELVKKVI